MFGLAKNKEKERYYLFAGMGGRALRRKNRTILGWCIVAGLLVSLALAGLLYMISNGRAPGH